MARQRIYHRDSFVDERLLRADGLPCSRDALLVLLALKPIADRSGRLEDRPMRIRMDVFPCYLDLDVDRCLQELAELPTPAIARYEVDGARYLQILNWDQNPHPNEVPSKLPPPPAPAKNAKKHQPSRGITSAHEGSRTIVSAPEGSGGIKNLHEGSVYTACAPADPDSNPVVVVGVEGSSEDVDGEQPLTGAVFEISDPRAREGEPDPPPGLDCPRCGRPLRRERGLYASETTGGKGWMCGPRRAVPGACGAVFPRDAPEIVAKLSPGAREALDREIAAERDGRMQLLEEQSAIESLAAEFLADVGRKYSKAAPDSAEAIWQRVSDCLAASGDMQSHSFGMWIKPSWGFEQLDDGTLVVIAPGPDGADFLATSRFQEAIHRAGLAECGEGFKVRYAREGQVLLERFGPWATARKLKGSQRLAVLAAVQRRLGEAA